MSFLPHHPTHSSLSCVFVLLVAAYIGIFKIPARALLHKELCFLCQERSCFGANRTLLAPAHIMKETDGSRPSAVGWRPKAALFQGSDVRRARMHWGCRALESNTWSTHSPGRYLSMSPLSFVCFHTEHLGCVVSLSQYFFWARDVFQSSTFLVFISSLFSVRHLYLYGKDRHQDLPATAVQILHFGGESKLNLWVSIFLNREGYQNHILDEFSNL